MRRLDGWLSCPRPRSCSPVVATAAYEDRVERGMGALRTAHMFIGIAPAATEIPGTGLTMRFPKFIDGSAKAFNEQSAEPNGQGNVNPGRLNPPYLKIPGLRVTYEMPGFDPGSGEMLTSYCYLAALPAADAVVEGKPIEEWIQAQLAKTFGDAVQWEDVKCPTQAGVQTDWRAVTVKGNQIFLDVKRQSQERAGGLSSCTQKSLKANRVLVGWRYPQKFNQPVNDVARLAVGSVAAAQPAAQPPAN